MSWSRKGKATLPWTSPELTLIKQGQCYAPYCTLLRTSQNAFPFSICPGQHVTQRSVFINSLLIALHFDPQQAAELAAEKTRKVRLRTWFHWRTNASKKNRGLKKEISVFETALLLKSHAKFIEEIYMDMVYDEQIKPLVKAKQEAGNIATAGRRMALGRKFCKELVEDESDEVKQEVREKYNKQKKVKKDMLDDKANDDDETDADAIAKGIDNLPIICQRFACLIKKKTRFIVSYTCAGPHPRQNWDIVTLLCHPSETPAGSNFSQLCPDKDNTFLAAYQQYAELIFSPNKHNPLLPDVRDDDETNELEGCNNGKEPKDAEKHAEDGEENNKGQHGDSIDWDNLGFASSSTGISDTSPLGELNQSAFYSETHAQFDALFGQAQPDALFGQTQSDALFGQTQPDALFGQAQPDASLKHAWHNTATMLPNPISVLQSSVPAPSFTDTGNTIGGRYDTQYDTHTWNLTNSDSQGWEMSSLSSFLSSPISAERSTTTTEQDEALPQFTHQLPMLPAANPPSPNEGTQDLADTHAGADLAKSKRKFKSKPPAAKVKHNSTIAPTNTAKPKAKLKERPVAKSGVITETSHAAADEGNTLVHSTTINTTTTKQNPVAQRASKRIPIKSKWNDVADAIGSDGLTFIGIGKENPSVSEDVGATFKLMKRPANSTMEGVIPAKYV
ncbi:hypothetical protein DFH29DRAFT_1006749 [Suillus ampliporus]|nr:hypothetical protein DFH29DRAFT_1006749 [Suillus ampliporus]